MVTRVAGVLLVAGGVLSVTPDARVPVTIYAAVTDSQGRAITDLTAQEIDVVAAGRPVPVELGRVLPEHTTRVVLIDATGSVSYWPMSFPDDLQAALSTALRAAPASPARLLIHGVAGPFGTSAVLPHGDAASLTDLLRQVRAAAREPSPIWDATIRSIGAAHGAGSPVAMLLVTDGRATGNRCSVNEATQVALLRGARVSVLALGGPTVITMNGKDMVVGDVEFPSGARVVDPGQIMRQVAEATGGRFVPLAFLPLVQTPPALGRPGGLMAEAKRRREMGVKVAGDAIGAWLEHSRHQYRLQLELPATGAALPLSVTVRRPGVNVLAPKAYVTSSAAPACVTKTP